MSNAQPAAKLPPIWCSGCGRVYDPINCPRYCECDCGTDTDDMELAPDWLIELHARLAELQKPCVWTYDEYHCKWDTACGNAYLVIWDTPAENGMKFCPYCGHPIKEE